MGARAEPARRSPEREWWLRALAVLQAPAPVFPSLRDDSDEAAEARSEPVLALAYLAGIALVLASPVSGRLLDDIGGGAIVVAAWALFAGAIYGAGILWVGGLLLHLASRRLGSLGSYRRARHVLAFALAPLALSLLVLWPVRLGLYGSDLFRTGGADHGSGPLVLHFLDAAFGLWAVGLLVVGVRVVHGWTVGRSLAAVGLGILLLPLLAVLVRLL
jgi:hypothetical protein